MNDRYHDEETGAAALVDLLRGKAVISSLHCPPGTRRQGGATRVLCSILADADREGLVVTLVVYDDAVLPDADELAAWYRQHGFARDQPDRSVGWRYIRYPKTYSYSTPL